MAFLFGVGTLQISGLDGVFAVGRLQNVSINISYENTQMRGGTDIFPVDTQFFDGSIEGSFDHADIELSQIATLIAGTGNAFAGAGGSGTITLTATQTPHRFALILSGVTDGITSTLTLLRVYCPALTLDFSRTDYMVPGATFICESSDGSSLATWQM